MSRKIIITGSAGFIGANFTKYWSNKYPDDYIIGIDSRTYAASDHAINDLKRLHNYQWIQADITHAREMERIFETYRPDHVFHFAAESHVCRSIEGPEKFFHTNVIGTVNLLEAMRKNRSMDDQTFYYVSTDEIYGVASENEPFRESSRLDPRSPYSASKAAGNLALDCYRHTYGMRTLSSSCTNNFGPYQHEEKLLPKTWLSMLKKYPMTVYGTGKHVRDWLPVEYHCTAIDQIFHHGQPGVNYLVGSGHTRENMTAIREAQIAMANVNKRVNELVLTFSDDRPTDDAMYCVDNSQLIALGWTPPETKDIYNAMCETAKWYAGHYEN